MGANFEDGWSSDNKSATKKSSESIEPIPPNKHRLYFSKEKRRGKVVTIVQPFYVEKSALQSLLKKIKKSLGTGGTLKENRLEFQGDIADTLRRELQKLDFGMK